MLTKLFYYLPLNALAANVIVAALSLVDFHEPGYFLLYLIYLIYWYTSTCFTSTKEAALLVSQEASLLVSTSTKEAALLVSQQVQKYLLY